MKVKNVVIEIRSLKSVLHEAAEVMGKLRRGEKVEPKFGIGFENINALRKVITEKRLELLKVIKEKSPDSVYELANLVGRDLKTVNDDLAALKYYGLVSLTKSKEKRAKVKPEVLFDKLSIEIPLSESQNLKSAKAAQAI